MRRVVFFDRDGVVNDDTDHYYIYKPADFKLNEGIIDAFKFLISKGYDIIIITNQGGISKGVYSIQEVKLVHKHFLNLLKQQEIVPLAIYFCPHHSDVEKCLCRKPNGLMIEKALARFSIDKNQSFMIGDREKDVKCAHNAGINGYKIETNENCFPLVQKLVNE